MVCCEACTWTVGCDCTDAQHYINSLAVAQEAVCADFKVGFLEEGCTCTVVCDLHANCDLVKNTQWMSFGTYVASVLALYALRAAGAGQPLASMSGTMAKRLAVLCAVVALLKLVYASQLPRPLRPLGNDPPTSPHATLTSSTRPRVSFALLSRRLTGWASSAFLSPSAMPTAAFSATFITSGRF